MRRKDVMLEESGHEGEDGHGGEGGMGRWAWGKR